MLALQRTCAIEQVCIVTGGNAGIGLATAEALANRGAHVVLACRRWEKRCRVAVAFVGLARTMYAFTFGHTFGDYSAKITAYTLLCTSGWPEPYMYGVCTVSMAGASTNLRSFTVYIYGSGQPHPFGITPFDTNKVLFALVGAESVNDCVHSLFFQRWTDLEKGTLAAEMLTKHAMCWYLAVGSVRC